MITLAKSGDTILFTFDENQHYLQNGTIEVPLNSLMLVTDESEMFTFKKAATNDIFVSARYSDVGMSKSELETWYKENMVGGGGLPTDEIQEMIDESISGKVDTSAFTEYVNDWDDKEQVIAETFFELKNDKADASAVTAEISAAVSGKADTTAVTQEISAAVSGKADTSATTYSVTALVGIGNDGLHFSTMDKEGSQINYSSNPDIKFGEPLYADYDDAKVKISGISSITSSVTSASTDSQIPTAKAVYDAIPTGSTGGGKAISAGTNISVTTGETADTVNCTLPFSYEDYSLKTTISGNSFGGYQKYNQIFGHNNTFNGSQSSYSPTANSSIIGYNNNLSRFHNAFIIGQTNTVGNTVNNSASAYIFGMANTISPSSDNNSNNNFVIGSGNTISNKKNNYIFGCGINPSNSVEFSIGKYNNSVADGTESGNTFFSIGNGTANNARHNAFEIRQNGDIYISSGGTDILLQDHLGSTVEVSSAITSGDTNAVAGGAVYDKFDEVEQVTAAALNNLNDKFGGLKLVQISQADYNTLTVKDNSTLYIIV